MSAIDQLEAKRLGKNAEIVLSYKNQRDTIDETKQRLIEQLNAARKLAQTGQDKQNY